VEYAGEVKKGELERQSMIEHQAAPKTWRMLLADDHVMVREALSHMLEKLDPTLEVTHTNDVDSARAILTTDRGFNLILLDYNMPGMAGRKTIEEFRAGYLEVPVGVISGYLPAKSIEPIVAAGAVGVFLKTMSGPTLLMALKLALTGQVYYPWQAERASTYGAHQDDLYERSLVLQDMSDRQLRILSLVVAGEQNKAIARDIGLSEVTVKVQIAALCRRFEVNNRTQLAAAAIHAGIRGDTA
jgi:DNA-binding NarL/FixJ family response regulator